MKNFKILLFAIFLGLNTQNGWATFQLPPYVYTANKLAEAQAKAKSQNLPIVILYSDKKSTCPKCDDASNDVIYTLNKNSIMVYIEYSELNKLPDDIVRALHTPEAGDFIPKTAIVDCELKQVLYIIPYVDRNDRMPLMAEAKKKISQYRK